MPDKNDWQLELIEYFRQSEPERAEKRAAWRTAIGLQAVDGLTTSDYMLETAKERVEGGIALPEAKRRIESYYEQRENRKVVEYGTMEAYIVSTRIAELDRPVFACGAAKHSPSPVFRILSADLLREPMRTYKIKPESVDLKLACTVKSRTVNGFQALKMLNISAPNG